ncbi:hypothetical protein CgunFtcFv8_005602 [Champsocephalus gunnari]|uniref:Uncharacterized protein n=1 Tax=Champsocephalus gunnari TaxID=52237 RepID=A0AAN8CVW7_CHAGU|nr:hypothetical protein CgunFtcFv8_005602 [Champsocephalus gunnari]
MNKRSHHTVNKPPGLVNIDRICTSPPPAPLGEHDLHARVPMVKLVQVLLHLVQQLNTGHIPQVIAATVDEEDIRDCSSSQGVGKEREDTSPAQSTPTEPAHPQVEAKVAADGLCSSLGSTPDIAVSDYPYSHYGREINESNKCFR